MVVICAINTTRSDNLIPGMAYIQWRRLQMTLEALQVQLRIRKSEHYFRNSKLQTRKHFYKLR
jgi:hypothetical protein